MFLRNTTITQFNINGITTDGTSVVIPSLGIIEIDDKILLNTAEDLISRDFGSKIVCSNSVDLSVLSTNQFLEKARLANLAEYAKDINDNVTGLVNLTGGVIGGVTPLTGTRSTTIADNGVTLTNSTTSAYTVTIAQNTIAQGTMFQQESTGTITLVAGSGVAFIGASLATAGIGQLLTVLPTSTANTYIVKLGA